MDSDFRERPVRLPNTIPEDWRFLALNSVSEPTQWPTISRTEMTEEGYPVFSANGAVGFYTKYNHAESAIAIGCRGTCGSIFRTPEKSWISGNAMVLEQIDRASVSPDFLFHALCYRNVSDAVTGSAQPQITRFTLKAVRFPAPQSPDEQAAIARILDAADTAIERARVAVEKAERVRFGLLQRLLGSGVIDHGSQTTKAGPVPKNWELSTIGQEFDVSTGFTLGEHRKPKVNRRRYLRVANVQRGYIKLDDVSELEARDHEMAERTLAVDDLLVVEGHADPKQIGRCAIVLPEAAGLTFQNHLFRLRPKRVLPKFGEIWLNGFQCQRYWQRTCATSSGLNTINQRKLKALPIAIPSPDEQRQVVELVTSAETTCSEMGRRLAALECLKRGLMQDLLTGRVRVKSPAGAPAPAVPLTP